MPIEPYSWVKLAGNFPCGLVTNNPDSELDEGSTPNATGISATAQGYLQAGTILTGASKTARTYTIGTTVYYWHYDRLWRNSASVVTYGAPYYTGDYYAQGLGNFDLNESSSTIVKFLPIGGTGLIFIRSTGANIVKNCNDKRGFFYVNDFNEQVNVTTATHATELDGLVYFVNSNGLFSVNIEGKVEELSLPVRGEITPAELKVTYGYKIITIGSAMMYDVNAKKFFKYSGSTFNYFSRQLKSPVRGADNGTIAVSHVNFEFDKTSIASGDIVFKTQVEQRGWSRAYTLPVLNRRESNEQASIAIAPDTGLTWQLNITSMPSNMKIKNIFVRIKGFTPESRSS